LGANPAPVAFFVYKRLDHARRTLEALASNELAAESDLFIFSDGARGEQDLEGVRAVRDYVRAAKGFKSVTIRESEKNQGLARSIISGISELCDLYGRAIIVEDDVLVSCGFLRFMNDALEKYEDDDNILSVCGFWPLEPVPDDDRAFFLNCFSAWGWATWKRAWDLYDYDAAGWEELARNRRMARDFDLRGGFCYTSILLSQVRDGIDTWDIQWYWATYRLRKLCVYPPYSLTTNIGFDDSGEHTSSNDRWMTQYIDLGIDRRIEFSGEPLLDVARRRALGDFHYFKSSRAAFTLRYLYRKIRRTLRRISDRAAEKSLRG
jgi:hypothetical protein